MAKKDDSKGKKFVRKALTAILGGAPKSGFVENKPKPEETELVDVVGDLSAFDPYNYPGKLETEAQGRKFAIEFLKEIERRHATDEFSAIQSEPDQMEPGAMVVYRTGPQSSLIRDTFDVVYTLAEEMKRGFFTIISDYLGASPNGHMDASGYDDWEADGKLSGKVRQPFTAEEVEKAKRERDASIAASLEEHDRAKGPSNRYQLGEGDPERIEAFLIGTAGQSRRAATAFLAMPYDGMADSIKGDKATAEAFAEVAARLELTIPNYFEICSILETAAQNMKAALRSRKDGEKLLAKARKGARRG